MNSKEIKLCVSHSYNESNIVQKRSKQTSKTDDTKKIERKDNKTITRLIENEETR